MPLRQKVLLIGWDAADWEHINPLLDEGLLPALEGLVNRGVMGNLATLQPILSPMLWNSAATGKYADKHGILGFIEPDPVNGGARPYTSISRKVKAVWNILSQSGLRSNVVGWWASHPAEPINGTVVTNGFNGVKFSRERGWSIPAGTIHPPGKSPLLARHKIFPNELSGEHLLPFIPKAAEIDQEKDQRLNSLAKILSDNASIHAVATSIMEDEPWDFTAVYYDGIDHFCHAFMSYHPPRLPWVPERDFEIYQEVIRGAYRFHDMMLERMLHLAGPDTTVILCSDHGFESGGQRPKGVPREPAGPAAWHRQYGIVVVAGPDIKRDERIYGASLIDITPTILTLFDLPVGEDMDGRPLLELFETTPSVRTIPSWEKVAGDAGRHESGKEIDRDQSDELMRQFAALGYIENPGTDRVKQAEAAEIEANYNVARTYLWKAQPEKARRLLEELVRRRPWEDRFLLYLASAYFEAGFLRQAERLLNTTYQEQERNATVLLLLGKIKLAFAETDAGLGYLLAAEEANPLSPQIHLQLGRSYLRLLRWSEAEASFVKTLALDEENAHAWQGLSTVYCRLRRHQKTVDAALRAVSLLHRLPQAHFNLGVALSRGGELERARVAFETVLCFQPGMVRAHRYLAALHNQNGGDREKARLHRSELSRLTHRRFPKRHSREDRAERLFDLPAIPSASERGAILLRERPDTPSEEKTGKTFIIVSGLPRSGTSLMMQLLAAGGIPPLTDGKRTADVDNPRGYFEWEAIKQIARQPQILEAEEVSGKAIKCISMLLPHLPQKHSYKIIFMQRPIEEVTASQKRMITRVGSDGANLTLPQLQRGLRAHRAESLRWLAAAPHVDFITVDYPALVYEPEKQLQRVTDFLGADRLPAAAEMSRVIDPALRRHNVRG
ncbi:MAG: alkaline phosphatase family protein [Spartobacteria bacterium]